MAQAKILIVGLNGDPHVQGVRLALERKGHRVCILYPQDFPTKQFASFRIDQKEFSWSVEDNDGTLSSSLNFSTVWLRRPVRPHVPEEYLHPSDRPIAERECERFYRAMWHFVCVDAFVVNPIASLETSESKLLQLKKAQQVGLTVPKTLVSNKHSDICQFIKNNEDVIFKTFTPNHWMGPTHEYFTYASRISIEDLPPPEILRATPGIFQTVIDAEMELRVTAIGDHFFCGGINYDGVDYRREMAFLPVEKTELPSEVTKKLRALMVELDIFFGCFDLLIDRGGQYVFLEVNPVGQWLWKELANPQLLLLDAFTEMLVQGKPDFEWSPDNCTVRYEDLLPHTESAQGDNNHMGFVNSWSVFEKEA